MNEENEKISLEDIDTDRLWFLIVKGIFMIIGFALVLSWLS